MCNLYSQLNWLAEKDLRSDGERSHVFLRGARIFDGNGSAVSAFKVPRHDYLSSFCRVHALIGGIINHIAVARFAHPLRSCRYALLLYAPPWTRALTRDGLIAYHVVMAIIISRCWPCFNARPSRGIPAVGRIINSIRQYVPWRSVVETAWADPPFSFLRATKRTDRRHFSRSLDWKIYLLSN